MFTVDEPPAEAIHTAFDRGGELSAALELRRRLPPITDNEKTLSWRCARRRIAPRICRQSGPTVPD
jgi:hypothetical protein